MQVSKTQAQEALDAVRREAHGFNFVAGGVSYFVCRPFNGAHDNEVEIHFKSPKGAAIEVALIMAESAVINVYVDRVKAGLQVRDTAQIEPAALRALAAKALRATLRECHSRTLRRARSIAAAERARLRDLKAKI